MKDIIILLILIVALGLAIGYIIKEKKKGTRCIGCPAAGNCSKACLSDKKWKEKL